ncbi:MAG: hypothetical protein ACXW0J_03175 [Nitrososphaeraceae archaeon]
MTNIIIKFNDIKPTEVERVKRLLRIMLCDFRDSVTSDDLEQYGIKEFCLDDFTITEEKT